ncbi:MAG: preprotein translocase subunit Sec61beta [archaeon]
MTEKIQMPSSGGGLIRYFDDYKSKLEITPTVIIIAIVIVILLELYLHKFRVLG